MQAQGSEFAAAIAAGIKNAQQQMAASGSTGNPPITLTPAGAGAPSSAASSQTSGSTQSLHIVTDTSKDSKDSDSEKGKKKDDPKGDKSK